MRQYALMWMLLFAAFNMSAQTQQRGVEISFFPKFTDTTAGNIIQFELTAKNEDGEILKDWNTTGYPIDITLRGSTADVDTNLQSWNADKLGYSFVELYDSYGRSLPKSSPQTFQIASDRFGSGKLLLVLQCTKAEPNLYIDISPKTAMSAKQNSPLFSLHPAAPANLLVDLTEQNQEPYGVYRMREFEAVVALRDRFMNTIPGEMMVKWNARFESELVPGSWMDPQTVEFPASFLFTMSAERDPAKGHVLQWLKLSSVANPAVSGTSDPFAVLPHAPGSFDLVFPPDNYNINLDTPETPFTFEWGESCDPYTDILVSRTEGRIESDDVLYDLYFLEKESLVRKVRIPSDNAGRAVTAGMTHGDIAQAATAMYGPGAKVMDAYWTVEATDGMYQTLNSPVEGRAHSGYRLTVNLETLPVGEPLEAPGTFSLKQNYPNPFNPSTAIAFTVSERTPVRIGIFDVRGALVRTLVDTQADPGNYTVVWDARTDAGAAVSSGTYIVRMEAGGFTAARAMSLVK